MSAPTPIPLKLSLPPLLVAALAAPVSGSLHARGPCSPEPLIAPLAAADAFGTASVALDGSRALVGAPEQYSKTTPDPELHRRALQVHLEPPQRGLARDGRRERARPAREHPARDLDRRRRRGEQELESAGHRSEAQYEA